jgi:GNAT superfamily N-acetyltransferase
MRIISISTEQTYPLRHAVLWPDKPLDFVKVPDDEQGLHFGIEHDGQLVSVISLFFEGEEARFRKFATHPNFQRKGIGSQLLTHTIEIAKVQGCQLIWCDARLDAQAFYERFGMKPTGDIFYKGAIPYTKMVKSLF